MCRAAPDAGLRMVSRWHQPRICATMHTVGLRCRCSPPSGPTLHMHRCPPAATVLRSRGKIRFMKRTHADKTLGSCESRLHEPELDSNDDLTGANVSRARTLASAARQKATRGKLKMQTDGYSRHVLRSKPRKMPRNWRRKRQCATVRAAISHARTHARARVTKCTPSNAPCKAAKRNRCHSCVP